MKIFKKSQPANFGQLSEKKQKELLLKAAKSANQQQKQLESKYVKLQPQK
ncbi:MAG: hypothetical protein ABI602_00260 [Candidatus Saccharibacteria bacterium]